MTIPRSLIVKDHHDRRPKHGMIIAERVGGHVWASDSYWIVRDPKLPANLGLDLAELAEGERRAWEVTSTGLAHDEREGADLARIVEQMAAAIIPLSRAVNPAGGLSLVECSDGSILSVFTDDETDARWHIRRDYMAMCEDGAAYPAGGDLGWFGHSSNLQPLVPRRSEPGGFHVDAASSPVAAVMPYRLR